MGHGLPLTTDRLQLRQFTPADVDDMYAYWGREDVTRYLYRPARTREQCADVIAELGRPTAWESDGDRIVAAVCRRTDAGVIGEVVLKLDNARARQVEIGWIFHPDHSGRGYASEAADAMLRLAFDRLGAHRVFARVDAENAASARLCVRLGMRHEAHFVENDLDGERWGSEDVFALLDRELASPPSTGRTSAAASAGSD